MMAHHTLSVCIASFPGRSHRQYFIASSMEYGGGRPGRSGHVRCRHTEGGAQRRISTSCVVLSVQWLDIRAFTRQTIDTVCCSQRRGRINARDQISQAFPRGGNGLGTRLISLHVFLKTHLRPSAGLMNLIKIQNTVGGCTHIAIAGRDPPCNPPGFTWECVLKTDQIFNRPKK